MTTDKTKAKIQELCPDVMLSANPAKWTITIAVVLRAIDKIGALKAIHMDGRFSDIDGTRIGDNGEYMPQWNLEHDNYDAQSQETKDFIGSLLGV